MNDDFDLIKHLQEEQEKKEQKNLDNQVQKMFDHYGLNEDKPKTDVVFTPHGIKDDAGEILDIEFELEGDENSTL